ncbi:MAG: DUF1214 domain-containing protein [bacterium]|nr:DUF1214 domain-containing protein [bacterium]
MSETQDAIQRIVDGTSWDQFCDALKEAGSVILSEGAPSDPLTRAEGWRYLTRLTRAALESFVEASDPQAPELRRTAHETIKMGMDNPDNIYLSAPIRGSFRYRMSGTRGTVQYLGFGTQKGNYGATGSLETTGYLDANDLVLGSDGSFDIVVSCEEQPGNWLPMAPESSTLIVRQTRCDHATEVPAQIRIERIDEPSQPRHLDPRRIDQALRKSTGFVRGCATIFETWAEDFAEHTNELPRFDPERAHRAGGDPNIAYYHSYWRLESEEALVIEVTPPECDYWNFQLANHWLESLDYRYFPVHLNPFTAKLSDDGSVRVVVSRENPGVDNWLDTCEHAFGTMCWRWIGASEHPQPRTRVVPLEELRR